MCVGAESEWESPRTEYGQPDLQGYWNNSSQTTNGAAGWIGEASASIRRMRHWSWSSLHSVRIRSGAAPLDPGRQSSTSRVGTIMFPGGSELR